MSGTSEALEDVDLLLENSAYNVTSHFTMGGAEFTPDELDDEDRSSIFEVDDRRIIQEQALDITKLYFQQGPPARTLIKVHLLKATNAADTETARTAVNVLFQIGAATELLVYLRTKYIARNAGYAAALRQLNCLVSVCWDGFTKEEIQSLRKWARATVAGENELGHDLKPVQFSHPYADIFRGFQGICAQANRILVLDVKQRIELGFNPEVNEDEAKLKEEFTKFGFPADLSSALDKIDEKLGVSRDDFDFKGCMDLLRSFTERLYRSILDQYGDEGKKVREQDSAEVAKFFVVKGLIGADFSSMLVSQRHFLSNLASHRLKSREEDARLSRNMVIEMSLYLLRRLQVH